MVDAGDGATLRASKAHLATEHLAQYVENAGTNLAHRGEKETEEVV